MALTWGDLNGKVHDKIIPTVADVVYKSSPVFIRVRTNNAQQFDGGVFIRQNIGYAELNGAAFGRGQSFNTDYVPTDTSFQVSPKFKPKGFGLAALKHAVRQFSLIDSNAEMPTRRKATSHRERLSERTSFGMMQQSELRRNSNYERSAEMTDPSLLVM